MEGYFQAEIPARTTVMGVRLKPFCIGHALLLLRQGNPLGAEVVDWAMVERVDLLEALLICSGTFEESLRWIESRRGAMWIWWNGRRIQKMRERDFTTSCAFFEQYLQSGTALPDFWTDDKKSPKRGAPWLLQLKVAIMADLHLSEGEALNYPVAKAQHNLMTLWEMKGFIRLRSAEDDRLSLLAAEMRKEMGFTDA